MICQLCLAGGAGMGCICEDCEDRYNAAIARVAELERLCEECHEVIREYAPGFTVLLNKLETI